MHKHAAFGFGSWQLLHRTAASSVDSELVNYAAQIYKPLLSLLQRPGLENYTSDKAAVRWMTRDIRMHVW